MKKQTKKSVARLWAKQDQLFNQLRCALEDIGLVVTFGSSPILEMEFERPYLCRGPFPSYYAILGLRLEVDGAVSYSLEPMIMPETGDCKSHRWLQKDGPAKRAMQSCLEDQIKPALLKLGLKLGKQVPEIHKVLGE